MSKKIALLSVMCLCLNISCEKNKYTITMTPQGDSIQREVVCWREGENGDLLKFSQTQLNQFAKAYNVPAPEAEEKKYVFAGTFTEKLPNDIGGAGVYLHASTSMGDVFFYAERFRGNDDIQAGINERRQAVNELVDMIIGWFQSEMRWEWHFGKLQKFLDRDFRWDMQNVCLYGWSANLTEKNTEMGYRIVQYLSERHYFDFREFREAFDKINRRDNFDPLLNIVRKIAAEKMGYTLDEKLPKSLVFLSSTDSSRKSLENYLRTTRQYKTLLRKWEKQKKTNPNLRQPAPIDVMTNVLSRALGVHEFENAVADVLDVTLVCHAEPYQTNGRWNSDKQILEWSQVIENSSSKLPTFLFAAWAVANEAAQKARFGQIVLEKESLEAYAFWYKQLNALQQEEWDAFLESLTPGPELRKKIAAFMFKTSTPPEPADATTWKNHFEQVLSQSSEPSGDPATMPTTQSTQPTHNKR